MKKFVRCWIMAFICCLRFLALLGRIEDDIPYILQNLHTIRERQKDGIFTDTCYSCPIPREVHIQDIYIRKFPKEFRNWVGKHNRIIIYGAGNVGKRLSRYLYFHGYDFERFVVTKRKRNKKDMMYGKEISVLESVESVNDFGWIVGVGARWEKEILTELEEKGVDCSNIYVQNIYE